MSTENTDANVAGGAPNQAGSSSGVADPMAMRDTNTGNLRPLKIKTDASATLPANPSEQKPGPDTIKLKVIREKKKPAANLMAASQTIHLRATPTVPAAPEAAAGEQADAEPAKKTLVVQLPGAAKPEDSTTNTSTLHLKPNAGPTIPGAPGTGPSIVGPAQKKAGATLKIKPPVSPAAGGQETSTTAIKKPVPVDAASAAAAAPPGLGAPKLKLAPPPAAAQTVAATPPEPPAEAAAAPETGTGKMTLKIKPAPAGAGPGKTVSLPPAPAPSAETVSAAQSTVALSAPPPAAQSTVEITPPEEADAGDGKKKKRLTLSRGKGPVAPPLPTGASAPEGAAAAKQPGTGSERAAAAVTEPGAVAPEAGAEPGIGYLLAAVASLLAIGALTAVLVMQYMRHIAL